ncbi:hypothetical protein ASC90_00325 [Rhizobium sp. Root1220]|nr:hypothetical protein ASC90_00325 [Rhizobium sp. Root1220]
MGLDDFYTRLTQKDSALIITSSRFCHLNCAIVAAGRECRTTAALAIGLLELCHVALDQPAPDSICQNPLTNSRRYKIDVYANVNIL